MSSPATTVRRSGREADGAERSTQRNAQKAQSERTDVLYEVVLRFEDRPDEIRLHDRAVMIGNTLTILGRQWLAVAFEAPVRSDATARVVLREERLLSQTDPATQRLLEVF